MVLKELIIKLIWGTNFTLAKLGEFKSKKKNLSTAKIHLMQNRDTSNIHQQKILFTDFKYLKI